MTVNLTAWAEYFARTGPVILLESQSNEHPWSRKSYLAADPQAEIRAFGRKMVITEKGKQQSFEANPWQALEAFRKKRNDWMFGYLGYDLKNFTEQLNSRNPDTIDAPDLYFMIPGVLLELDHNTGKANVLSERVSLDEVIAEKPLFFEVQKLRPQLAQTEYLARIDEAKRRIHEGDFYEINLSHQLKGQFRGSPRALYNRMKDIGPVPFGAYLQVDGISVCCQSPERFLRKEDDMVFSQPIKGTAGRGKNLRQDEAFKQALAGSAKERAENLMIVDLVRNDLSRIAEKGSVKVKKLFDIESFGTVHQMVSTIQARVGERDPVQILEACFPMGSMTGAPKISAMKTIDELENYRRGIYSGAIGYLTPDGDFDFNVVIRTAIMKNNELFYAVGGAITGDSNPVAEWKETMVKARALVEAVER